jgi:hypothetical protein
MNMVLLRPDFTVITSLLFINLQPPFTHNRMRQF